MAFQWMKSLKRNQAAAAAAKNECGGPVDPSAASTSTDLAASPPPEVQGKQKKRFWPFTGIMGKKFAALQANFNQQAQIINDLKDTMATDKESYEREIARLEFDLKAEKEKVASLQSQSSPGKDKSEVGEKKNKKMVKTRDAGNMTLVEAVFASPSTDDAIEHSSPDSKIGTKAAKKLHRQKKRDQKNGLKFGDEIA